MKIAGVFSTHARHSNAKMKFIKDNSDLDVEYIRNGYGTHAIVSASEKLWSWLSLKYDWRELRIGWHDSDQQVVITCDREMIIETQEFHTILKDWDIQHLPEDNQILINCNAVEMIHMLSQFQGTTCIEDIAYVV